MASSSSETSSSVSSSSSTPRRVSAAHAATTRQKTPFPDPGRSRSHARAARVHAARSAGDMSRGAPEWFAQLACARNRRAATRTRVVGSDAHEPSRPSGFESCSRRNASFAARAAARSAPSNASTVAGNAHGVKGRFFRAERRRVSSSSMAFCFCRRSPCERIENCSAVTRIRETSRGSRRGTHWSSRVCVAIRRRGASSARRG
jgi:hypothetical protein